MRTILHIDMNSYFATVEQQANPKLRGKPVAVLGSKAKRSIIVAASVEAKKFGVKTGTRIEDAPKLCPDIIFVHGEPRKYSFVTKKFIEIFEDFTDKVEIFSIDEAFLDVTKTMKLYTSKSPVIPAKAGIQDPGALDPGSRAGMTNGEWAGAINIANEIKRQIKSEIGEYITCSVGIAKNKFLAKTGSDLQKPDGLTVITDANVDEILLALPLDEFCGIGKRINQRLGCLGIENTEQLRGYPNVLLNKEFGIATGEKLKRMAYGLDNSPVISRHDRADAKSYSHARTLNKNITNRDEIKKHILLLSEKIAFRMRKDGCMAKEIGLWLRFGDFGGVGKRHRLGKWTHDGIEIYDAGVSIMNTLNIRAPVRAIGVLVSGVQKKSNITMSFLDSDMLNEKILNTMDTINNRFGETVITKARLTGTKIKEIVSGMGRDKF